MLQSRHYRVTTLVDITYTGSIREGTDLRKRNQQRNWETLVQVLGLRTQINIDTPIVESRLIPKEFNSSFSGQHNIWTVEFTVEIDDIFFDGISQVGLLNQDFVNVPIITGLTETATFSIATFDAIQKPNIFFEVLS